jgi:hypothetical protein
MASDKREETGSPTTPKFPKVSALVATAASTVVAVLATLFVTSVWNTSDKLIHNSPPLQVIAENELAQSIWTQASEHPYDFIAEHPNVNPNDSAALLQWVHTKPGPWYDVGSTDVRLVVQGNADSTVVVTDIRANVLSKREAVSGSRVDESSAGVFPILPAAVVLDSQNLSIRSCTNKGEFADNCDLSASYFQRNSVSLSQGEVAEFRITAIAKRGAYEWELLIEYIIDGQSATLSVDADGEPFRTTAPASKYKNCVGWDNLSHPGKGYFVQCHP